MWECLEREEWVEWSGVEWRKLSALAVIMSVAEFEASVPVVILVEV